jgi:predicted DNA-binding transcriptional regulator AlpA
MIDMMAQVDAPALLTLEQAAGTLQVDRVTLWRWSLTGRFPVAVLRLGRARRVRAAELAAWIGAGCPAGRDRWTWTGK